MWRVHVESTLHTALSESDVRFGIGHGDVNGITSIHIEDEAYSYKSYRNGSKLIMDFLNPFWSYWGWGMENSKQTQQIWWECESSYASYLFLLDKPESELTSEEKAWLPKLKKQSNDYQREADRYYSPSLEVMIDNRRSYKIATFSR